MYSHITALAMGDYVYIDGGEIAILVDDEPVNMPSRSTHHPT